MVKQKYKQGSAFRMFAFSAIATVIVFAAVGIISGIDALTTVIILSVIEITFSFDNAIVNAKVLTTLSPMWRRLFLTIGIVIAIFGMRLLFPILLIVITSHTGFADTIHLALYQPKAYAHEVELAHPAISAFGGTFLLLLALDFFLIDRDRPMWLKVIERPLRKINRHWVTIAIVLVVVLAVSNAPGNEHTKAMLSAGVIAVITFLAINIITALPQKMMGERKSKAKLVGMAAFASFIYLELLDASFSLDAVLGAFAVTNSIIFIAAGLGVGAVWVRSMTVYMVKRGTLNKFVYIEHGAHYAILVLAISLLASVFIEIPNIVVGGSGLLVVAVSVIASNRHRLALRKRVS